VTFVPCVLFILLGAPYVERLRGNAGLSAALTGVTAAVVGVIANLALFFAVHTLFSSTARVTLGPLDLDVPRPGSLQVSALAVTLLGFVLVFTTRWTVLRVLGACALAGIALHLLTVALGRLH
jgi:chromate transporter